MAHTCNPSTWEIEEGRLEVQGQPQLHSKFPGQPGSPETLSQNKTKQNKKAHKQKPQK